MTDDIAGSIAQAVEAGGRIAQPVSEVPGAKVAFVLDPEDNEIEFVQFISA